MKAKLILKSLGDLPSPAPEPAEAPACSSAMPGLHLHSTEPTAPGLGRWDPKEPSAHSLVTVLGRMAPAHLHVN